MADNTPKSIDLDELVNTLLREREEAAEVPASAETKETSAGEKPSPQPKVIPAEEPVAVQPEGTPAKKPIPPEPKTTPAEGKAPSSPRVPPVADERTYDLVPEEPPRPKKKRSWRNFFRRPESEEQEPVWDDWDLTPIGHYRTEETDEVELIVEETPEEPEVPVTPDEFPPVQAVAETITMPVMVPAGAKAAQEEVTRVIPAVGGAAVAASAPVQEPEPEPLPDDQLPDQLSLEEMVRVESIDPEAPEEEHDPEELVQQARQERIQGFTLNGEEEEPNEPEEEVLPEEDIGEIEDYTTYEDTKAVSLELQYRCRTALFGLLATAALELVLLVLTVLATLVGETFIPGMGYLTVQLFGLGLMMVINYQSVAHGLSGLFTLRANSDTAVALAGVVSLMQVILHFIDSSALPFWAPVAGFLLTLCAAGRFAHAQCVRRNFAFVSYPGRKYAAALLDEEDAQREIGRRAVGDGEATVTYFRPAGFLSNYLENTEEEDRSDDWCRWVVPVGAGLSVILSVIFAMTEHTGDFWDWLNLFTGMVCLSMQVGRLAVQLPLNQCCRYMLSRGGFLVGWRAVRRFGSPDGLVVDVADLYPDESMLLHGIKTFSGAHIDDAILDAASLSVRSGGPLSMIFRRIIQNKEELLHEVDSLVYEQGMGLSGWVDGRRVLVGNRRLLENHGVDVPSSDYEARYAKNGRRLVYLSTAGELSAMFVVTYQADPDIRAALQELCRSRVTLLVRSCDPNITTESICQGFHLDPYYVDVLPAAAGRLYMQLVQEESAQAPAEMASNGHILGTARLLSVCRHMQAKSLIALLVQVLSSAVGLLLCIVWLLNNTLHLFLPLLFVLATALLSWLLPLFRRV